MNWLCMGIDIWSTSDDGSITFSCVFACSLFGMNTLPWAAICGFVGMKSFVVGGGVTGLLAA